jgi:hypothetical protein
MRPGDGAVGDSTRRSGLATMRLGGDGSTTFFTSCDPFSSNGCRLGCSGTVPRKEIIGSLSLSLSLDLAATLLGEEEAVIAEGDLVIAAISCSIHEGVDGCKTCHG